MRVSKSLISLLAALAASSASAQQLAPGVQLPPPDSAGWIKIFRGVQDTGNFYRFMSTTRTVPAQNKQPLVGGAFSIVGVDTIRSAGSPAGHFIFKQTLSHYRVSFKMRWPGNIGNAGLLMKVQENDTAQSQGFPRSVECQGDPGQGIGQIWALGSIREGGSMQNGGTWITVRGRLITHPSSWAAGACPGTSPQAAQYDSTQPEIHWGGGGDPCKNLTVGAPGFAYPRPASLYANGNWRSNTGWVTVEVETHGHDTTRHFVDGQLVMKYHSPRIAPRTKQDSVIKYLTSGLMAWQSEGSNVYYHDIKVKLLPQDPLYATLYPSAIRAAGKPAQRASLKPYLKFDRGYPVPLVMDRAGNPMSLSGKRLPAR
jgi:hypothetical protein